MSSIIKVDTIQTAAGGTPTAADLGLNVTGGVLQVVQTPLTAFSSYSVASQGKSSNVISASITPTSTSSKILISCHLYIDTTTVPSGTFLNVDGTDIFIADASGIRRRATTVTYHDASRLDTIECTSFQYLHSPSSTSSLTYGVKVGHGSSVTQTVSVNRTIDSTDNAKIMNPTSSLTLMEIAG